jgi:hypothetical protein
LFEELPEVIGWCQGNVLTGLNIKRDEYGWLVVVKAESQGRSVVAFTGATYWQDIPELLRWQIEHNQLSWRDDRYAK